MNTILFLIAVLAGIVLARPLLTRLIPWLVANTMGRAIGADALAQQPDTIHLDPGDMSAFTDSRIVEDIAGPLMRQGFQDAGVHRVRELPVVVRMFVQVDESFFAAICQHPAAGVWLDIVAPYTDGQSVTYSTAAPSGLSQRPGHPTVNAPGENPITLLGRARIERPRHALQRVSTDEAAKMFENSYAESIAWRKKAGVSAGEVAEIARKKAA